VQCGSPEKNAQINDKYFELCKFSTVSASHVSGPMAPKGGLTKTFCRKSRMRMFA
jgi:hypothetical protein